MNMETVFERLIKFQEILTLRVKLEHEVALIPKALDTQKELLTRINRSYTEQKQLFENLERQIRESRQELTQAEAFREVSEKKMDAITTQREYETLSKEIRDATDKEQVLRKELQNREKEIADLEETVRKGEAMIRLQEKEFKEKSEKINAEKTKILLEIESKIQEEKIAAEGIDDDVRFKFERIIRSKPGLGIVPIKGTVCTGCYLILPAQFVNEVRSGNKISFCPYCSRVLFYQDPDQEEEQFFASIETGSLADLDDYSEEEDEKLPDEEEELLADKEGGLGETED